MEPIHISTNGTGGDNATENVTGLRDHSTLGLLSAMWDKGTWEMPIYLTVFIISVMGNLGVMINLSRKGGPKTTISNYFCFSLAVSHIALTIFCMPFTLVENVLDDFIFDEWLCASIQLIEGTSAASSVWTLVALSVERYYVICHPIRSRQWQTVSHARRIISTVWTAGTLLSVPTAIFHEIQPTPEGGRKCTVNWLIAVIHSLVTVTVMVLIPLAILGVTYFLIAKTLNAREIRVKIAQPEPGASAIKETSLTENVEHREEGFLKKCQTKTVRLLKGRQRTGADSTDGSGESSTIELRQTNIEQCLFRNKRAMRTINTVVLQFTVCWVPFFLTTSIDRHNPTLLDSDVGKGVVSVGRLLGYASGCFNPLAYFVMKRHCGKWFASLSHWFQRE